MNNTKQKEKLLKAEIEYLKASGWISKKDENQIVWKNPKHKNIERWTTQEIAASIQREEDQFDEEFPIVK